MLFSPMFIPAGVRAHPLRSRGAEFLQGPGVSFSSLKTPMLLMVSTPTGSCTISLPPRGGWNKVRPMPRCSQMEPSRARAATGSADTILPARRLAQYTAIFSVSMLPICTSPCRQRTGQQSTRPLPVIRLQRLSLPQRSVGKIFLFWPLGSCLIHKGTCDCTCRRKTVRNPVT